MDGQGHEAAIRGDAHRWIRHGRGRLNLAMRLASRSHSIVSLGGAARGPLRLVVAGASAVVDVCLARHLARSDRPATFIHGAVDAVDLVTWTLLQTRPGPGQLSTAMNSGHPLAVEAGARYGWRGLAVPMGGALVAEAAARSRGRRSDAAAFTWQVAAVAGGAGLSRYVEGLRKRRLVAHEAVSAAECARAELAAQNEVALGFGNVIDEVQRAASLVRLGAEVPQPRERSVPWKADLAERTRRSHHYLVDVLLAWQHDHNRRSSDLRAVVDLAMDPALAPLVVDASAADNLEDALTRFDLGGRVPVDLADPSEPSYRSHIVLRIGLETLCLDTGVEPLRLDVDPLPGGFAWLALWLAAAGPQDGVGPAASLGPAGIALGLTTWAHRSGRAGPSTPVVPAVLASSGLTLASSLIQTRRVGRPRDHPEIPRIPMSLGLRGHCLVTALSAPRLPRVVLLGAVAAGAASVLVAWRATPAPAPIREFAAELSWSVMAAAMARSFTEGIERDAQELEREVAAADENRQLAAARAGREQALAQVRIALDEAIDLERHMRGDLSDDLSLEARRRLDLAGRRLVDLGG